MNHPEVAARVRAGWTWIGPTPIGDPGAPEYFELRIAQLPDFLLAATTAEELFAELKAALRAFFESYAERGEALPPLPRRWSVGIRRPEPPPPQASLQRVGPGSATSGTEGVRLPDSVDGELVSA